MENREKLSSRLGFLLLSAGCAIGCGNVWKFPWMCGQYGGAAFVVIYLLCLLVLGLPVMITEFAMGRASQKSPLYMYQALENKGSKWHVHGPFAFVGNLLLMMFYTVVTGWMFYYFVQFVLGNNAALSFGSMLSQPSVNVGFMALVVVLGFGILTFNIQKGLERVTKYMMLCLFVLMIVLAVRSCTLQGAGEGLSFYLKPDFSAITGNVVVGAMNQAFFTLSLGIGSMAIFGSYIDKKRSLMGESISVICFDTLAALLAGLIIFPACSAYGTDVGAGPALLFNTMATVFNNMQGGRIWGALFFLFMVFAAMSTILAVFENILAMVREKTGWDRKKGSIICAVALFVLSLPCALGFNVWAGFQPFASGSSFLDLWDFCVSNCLLPIGSLAFVIFCSWGTVKAGKKHFGWGWENFRAEANTGDGLKLPDWMKYIYRFVVPVIIIVVFVFGMATFAWRDAPAEEVVDEPAVEEAGEAETEEAVEGEAAEADEESEKTEETK